MIAASRPPLCCPLEDAARNQSVGQSLKDKEVMIGGEQINMYLQKPIKFVFVLLLLTSCTPITTTGQPSPATEIVLPAATKTSDLQLSTQTVGDLRTIIYASNPESPQYDPKSSAYAEFPDAVHQLSMSPNAVDAAGDLAIAITFPRQDAYLAAQTLIALGPDITSTTIVDLHWILHNQKPEARIYSAILLSTTGDSASCAVGDIGPLLWDPDSTVRTAAAFALEKITKQDLIANQYEIVVTASFLANSIPADIPEGSIVGVARQWWNDQGSKINWHPSYGLCDP